MCNRKITPVVMLLLPCRTLLSLESDLANFMQPSPSCISFCISFCTRLFHPAGSLTVKLNKTLAYAHCLHENHVFNMIFENYTLTARQPLRKKICSEHDLQRSAQARVCCFLPQIYPAFCLSLPCHVTR